ncbi:uncharacterized protein EDB91DRAFT_1081211 [Suillus paluster]|uniref:uncharacterized protein n=1 Tax=Suillus paluster TaxID=48578 RepID=UPI001B869C95|nr:uncharacterized protein EDB91DRAFT_1081211 [Suillus paluster]KAG1743275.1 hypothetical protein EDB91DRAFT_1081211 [Suillus paluster]
MSLGNNKSHGMDSTMRMCNESCKQTQCEVGDQAIGWIEDKEKRKIIDHCYSDGVEYALKDCWVDEAKKDHEEKVLEMVWGIPNVVTLIAPWDVEYKGEPNSTLRIRNRHGKFSLGFCLLKAMTEKKVLHGDLSPNNLIIYEGCGFFIDFDHAQIIMQCNTSVHAWGTGTLLYMYIHLLRYLHSASKLTDKDLVMTGQTASNDLKSLFYIFVEFVTTYDGLHGKIIYLKTEQWADLLEDIGSKAVLYKLGLLLVKRNKELMNCTTAYFGKLKYLVQEWRLKFLQAVEESGESGIHHEDIEEVLMKWIYHEAPDEPLPVTQALSLSPVSILPLPVPRRSNRKTVLVKRP